MKHLAYIALGSNVGNREENLLLALQMLSEHSSITINATSSIYETEPVGYTDQPQFLNMVVRVQTDLPAVKLLQITQRIEVECGRVRDIRWGPRTLDLDILLFDRENIETEQLIVPHPRMMERNFVMVPLMEVADENVNEYLQSHEINESMEGMRIWQSSSHISFHKV
ncbi:2-amino-4-hydroxy-6-hydroxymethyldihydropteridine diphosphokinase [Bacillus tianshenii]|nr:2-amino-4-hydroxy-6-hydroxymethyldihydropteridine diphosphokinase [Bacillus tianshenii]